MSFLSRLKNIIRLILNQPIIIENDLALFVDIDDTITMWDDKSAKYRPHKPHLLLIEKFNKRKLPVVLWSAGGHAWASRIQKEYRIKAAAIMGKPRWFIDDLRADQFMPEVNRIYKTEKPNNE